MMLTGVVADQEVEGDDEPHGLEESEDGAGNCHSTLGPGDHLPRTAGRSELGSVHVEVEKKNESLKCNYSRSTM